MTLVVSSGGWVHVRDVTCATGGAKVVCWGREVIGEGERRKMRWREMDGATGIPKWIFFGGVRLRGSAALWIDQSMGTIACLQGDDE